MSADSIEVVTATASRRSPLRNPAFVAMIGLPAFAIVASLGMTAAAYWRGDPELPQEYHWEGSQLDADFAAAHRAAALDVRASLRILTASGMCRLSLTTLDVVRPAVLRLDLVHATRPELDQHLRLARHAGVYEAACRIPAAAGWRVELADEPVTWRVRQEFSGSLTDIAVAARLR